MKKCVGGVASNKLLGADSVSCPLIMQEDPHLAMAASVLAPSPGLYGFRVGNTVSHCLYMQSQAPLA